MNESTLKSNDTSHSSNGWIEVLQVISVLCGSAAVLTWRFEIAAAELPLLLALLAFASLVASFLLLKQPREEADTRRYVVTAERRATLEAVGIPKDIRRAVGELVGFDGSAGALRNDLFEILGQARGSEFLPTLLPYFQVYVPEAAAGAARQESPRDQERKEGPLFDPLPGR